MLTREVAESIIERYKSAWEGQDPEAILEIFTVDAIYHERVLLEPYKGHDEIRNYWQMRVVEGQGNINFKLLVLYIDGNTMIAEWDATFDDTVQNVRKHIKEVAIMTVREGKIDSLREYWASEIVSG